MNCAWTYLEDDEVWLTTCGVEKAPRHQCIATILQEAEGYADRVALNLLSSSIFPSR